MKLSIILPAYNEGKRINDSLKTISDKMKELKVSFEIIIVNDGSKDDTCEQARQCAKEFITVINYDQNRGKGYAIKTGMLKSRGDYRLFMDVDLATSLDAIPQFLKMFDQRDCDIIIGNRKNNPSLQEVRQPFYRRFFGEGFTRLSSLTVGTEFSDFTCGFKMYSQEAAETIFSRQLIFDWAFDTELIYIALKHNLKIFEAPVLWRHCEGSKVRIVADIINSLVSLAKIKINAVRGMYD